MPVGLSVAWGKDETVAALEELLKKAQAGKLGCTALRIFHKDGSFEDVVLACDTEEEKAAALAMLHARDDD
jgi:hypothetical protein